MPFPPGVQDFHLPHGVRDVGPAQQLHSDGFPAFADQRSQIVDGDTVHSWCALVTHDALVGGDSVT